jgi:hypothetical protein
LCPPDQAAFAIAGSAAKYALSGVLPPWAVWGRAVLKKLRYLAGVN